MGGVGGGKIITRRYCMKKLFSISKKKLINNIEE